MNNKKKYNGGFPQFIGGVTSKQFFMTFSIILNILLLSIIVFIGYLLAHITVH